MHLSFMSLLAILCSVAAYYLARSLVWTLPIRRLYRLLLLLPLALVCYAFPIERAFGEDLDCAALSTLMLCGGALTCYLIVLCVLRDVALLPLLWRGRPLPPWQARTAPLILLLALIFVAIGYHRAYDTQVVVVPIKLPAEAAPLASLRVVQLSDLHVTRLTPRDWLEKVVAVTNALEPDIICITGDIADLELPDSDGHMTPLKELRATYGVFFVDGNHEYYQGQIRAWRAFVGDMGFIELHNAHRVVEHEGLKVQVAGIPDEISGRFGQGSANVAKAVASEENFALRLLLSHRSQAVYEARDEHVDLVMAGHTHGGQFFPWNVIVALAQPHLKGLYTEGRSQVYVNQGTGFWAIPNRFGTSSEITLFQLTPQ